MSPAYLIDIEIILRAFKSTITLSIAFVVTLIISPVVVQATSLMDIYDRAAQSDPTIRAADATRLATREARPQAWSQFLPNIAATAGWSVTECGALSTQCNLVGIPGTTPTTTETRRGGSFGIAATEKINLPAMLRSLQRTDYVLAQAELAYHAAEQSLAVRVAQRYFNVLSAQDTLNSAQASLEAFNNQLDQQEKRFAVGLSANTDVQEARAARDSATATVISSKRSLASAQEQLREVAGDKVDNLAAPGDDMPLIVPDPQSEDEWVKLALAGNLTLAANRIAFDTATFDLGTLKTYRYPALTVGASYSNNKAFNNFDTRDGVNNWNGTVLSVGISVPLFSGGLISSEIRQGVYQQRAARENVELATRQTDSAARDAYLGMQSVIALVQANKQALESAQLALQSTEAGFGVGTRTTLDVLNSRKLLLTAEVLYEQSRYQYMTQLIILKQVTGTLNRSDLELLNSWLTK